MNNCLAFDGVNDCVLIPDVPSPANTGAVTIEFWNKVDAAQVKMSYAVIFDSPDNLARTAVHAPWGDKILYWDCGDITANGRVHVDYTPYLGKWTHIALVSHGKGGKFMGIYINGELKASRAASDGPRVDLKGFRIGGDGSQHFHRGCIESLRIWSVARTAADIKRGMRSDVIGDEEGLVSAFSFNQAFGGANNTWWKAAEVLQNRVPGQPSGALKDLARTGTTSNWVASDVVQDGPMAPVYRFYHPINKDHVLSSSPGERKTLVSAGWLDEGVAFYAPRGPRPGTTPLYRLLKGSASDHVYTISPQERGTLDARRDLGSPSTGYVQETIPCFVHRDPAPGLVALHRAVNEGAGDHLYTTKESDARGGAGFKYEGICAYVYPTIDTPFTPTPIRTLPEQKRLSQDVWYMLVPDSVEQANRALAIKDGALVVLAEIDEKDLSRFLWRCVPNVNSPGKIHLRNKALGNDRLLDSGKSSPGVGGFKAGVAYAGQAWTLAPCDTGDRKQGTDKLQLTNDFAGADTRLTAGTDGQGVTMTATNGSSAQRWRFVAMDTVEGYSIPGPPPALAAQPFTKHLQAAGGRLDILGTGTVSDWAMLSAQVVYENMLAAVKDQALVDKIRTARVLIIGRDDSNAAAATYPNICTVMDEASIAKVRGSQFEIDSSFCVITEEMMCKRGVFTRPGDEAFRLFDQTVHEFAHMVDFALQMRGDAIPAPNQPKEYFAASVQTWFGAMGTASLPGATVGDTPSLYWPGTRAQLKAKAPERYAYIERWFDPKYEWTIPLAYVTRY